MKVERVFSGSSIFLFEDVLCAERRKPYSPNAAPNLCIVLKGTTWNTECGDYNNAVHLAGDEAEKFLREWIRYRKRSDINDE